jgi:hypothetical protein
VEVVLPSGLDAYAHLVGHFALGRHHRGHVRRVDDFTFLAGHHGLSAAECATHLASAGLARAARYALGEVVAANGDCFARDVLAAFRPDPLGYGLVRVSGALIRRPAGRGRWSALAPHMMNVTLRAGVGSLGGHVGAALLGRVRAAAQRGQGGAA